MVDEVVTVFLFSCTETNPYPGLDAGELYTMIVNGQRPQLLASFSNEL